VEGSTENTGKRTGKDADRGKMTFPGLVGIEESKRRAKDLLDQAIAAVEPLGQDAKALIELAKFVANRDR